jgi:hypothetical protein
MAWVFNDSMSASPREQAAAAWETVGFPALHAGETAEEWVCVSPGGGRESLLPRVLFEPTQYNLRDPNSDDVAGRAAKRAHHAVIEAWAGHSNHVDTVLDYYHDGFGSRVGTDIFGEGMLLASNSHNADTAVTAARIFVGEEAGTKLGRTLVSLWDDGTPYESPEAIEAAFMPEDLETLLRADTERTPSQYVTAAAAGVFEGTLTVASGEHRVAFVKDPNDNTYTRYLSTVTTGPRIPGNLFFAELRHKVPPRSFE